MDLRVGRNEVIEHSQRVKEAWYALEDALSEWYGMPWRLRYVEGWMSRFDVEEFASSRAAVSTAESGRLAGECDRFRTGARNGRSGIVHLTQDAASVILVLARVLGF